MSNNNFPIPNELIDKINLLNSHELSWLSGYCWAKSQKDESNLSSIADAHTQKQNTRHLTVLSASQTGNAKKVAEKLFNLLQSKNLPVKFISAADYKSKDISSEDIFIIVTSTQGEGDPPEEAFPLYKLIYSKKKPNLSNVSFAVLSLGDSSYPHYCQAGKDFDDQLAILGATRIYDRVDCDLDYEETANKWINDISQVLIPLLGEVSITQPEDHSTPQESTHSVLYSKEKPYTASLSSRQKITARSAEKDIEHIEIDLSDSGIPYLPGDALGIWFKNDKNLVQDFLHATKLTGDELIFLTNNKSISIKEALIEHCEITQNNPHFVTNYAQLTQDREFIELVKDNQSCQNIVDHTPILALLEKYVIKLEAQQLYELLRPLTPRLYSISSAQEEVGDEVHLTVAIVRYEHNNKTYEGAASSYLGRRLDEGDPIQVYIEQNPHFRLPNNPDIPIIMIGSGTGIAPFRSFMQKRESTEANGKNWLLFGNQKFTDDFLYQTEWQRWDKIGLLSKISLAWSRKNPNQKIYVQHKLLEEAKEVWQWIQNGAHIYVCGDANKMAKDVDQALQQIIIQQGNMDENDADMFLIELRESNRYQRDVY